MTDLINAADVSSGEHFKCAEHEGELVIIEPLRYRPDMVTSAGTSDACEAKVTVLDGPGKGTDHPDALIFGKQLVPTLARNIGKGLVGRIGKAPAQPGKTAAWILFNATDADMATARAHIAGGLTTPADASKAPF